MSVKKDFNYDLILRVFDDTPVGILLMKDTKIVDVNKLAMELLEYDDKEELIGKNPGFFSPEYQPNGISSFDYAKTMFGVALEKGYNEFDWVHVTKTGKNVWFHIVLKKLVENTTLFVAYWNDITREKMIEYRFEHFMSNFPGRVYIKNDQLEYIYLNDMAKELNKDNKSKKLAFFDEKNQKSIEQSDIEILKSGGSREDIVSIKTLEGIEGKVFKDIKFAFKDVEYTNNIGGMLVDITELTNANKRSEKVMESLITTIQSITESRDPYTSGHEMRVSSLSVAIGKALGLDEYRLEGLRIGALIHDLGKIQVPLELLNKPGKLTKNQLNLVRDHSIVGYDLIKTIEFDWPIHEMVRNHHEKYDGSGYPDGLKGEDILLEARIICVADVLEAMSSHRPYRPKLPLIEAVRELRSGAGTLYDSHIVDTCLDIIATGQVDLKGWHI